MLNVTCTGNLGIDIYRLGKGAYIFGSICLFVCLLPTPHQISLRACLLVGFPNWNLLTSNRELEQHGGNDLPRQKRYMLSECSCSKKQLLPAAVA